MKISAPATLLKTSLIFCPQVKFLDHCKRQEVECGGDEENSAFTCSNCGKTFALERLLRDHVRSHM